MKTNGRPPTNANGTNPDPPATNGSNGTHDAPADERKQETNGSQPTTASPIQPVKAKSATHHNNKPLTKRAAASNKTRRPLTVRQERFAELVASGTCGTEAWVQVYGTSRDVARTNAAESLANPRISSRVAELREKVTRKTMLSLEDKREFLKSVVAKTDCKMSDKLRALELDAKLAGHFAPDKVEVEDGPKRLETIRERSAQIVSAMNRRALERSFESGATTTGSGLSRWNPSITRG